MNDKMQDNELEEVSGGVKRKRRIAKNGSCPKCGRPISVCSYQEVEGERYAVGTFWCHDCDIRWLRDEHGQNYKLVSLTPNGNGRLIILGDYHS